MERLFYYPFCLANCLRSRYWLLRKQLATLS